MSKSSFLLLLFTVASLTAAVGVNADGLRTGKPEWRYEAHESIASLQDDYFSVRSEAERAPSEARYFIEDIARDFRYLAADLRVDVRIATQYVAGMFVNATDRDRQPSPPASHT